nr:immunoglobulin heavy chain junction region [Mus musculus]
CARRITTVVGDYW